jgi:hypothetical protein
MDNLGAKLAVALKSHFLTGGAVGIPGISLLPNPEGAQHQVNIMYSYL